MPQMTMTIYHHPQMKLRMMLPPMNQLRRMTKKMRHRQIMRATLLLTPARTRILPMLKMMGRKQKSMKSLLVVMKTMLTSQHPQIQHLKERIRKATRLLTTLAETRRRKEKKATVKKGKMTGVRWTMRIQKRLPALLALLASTIYIETICPYTIRSNRTLNVLSVAAQTRLRQT